MLSHEFLEDMGILVVEPKGALESADFEALAKAVDPYIEAKGELHGPDHDPPSSSELKGLQDRLAIRHPQAGSGCPGTTGRRNVQRLAKSDQR